MDILENSQLTVLNDLGVQFSVVFFLTLNFMFLRMRYVAAYLLAALAGNDKPEAKDIKKILDSVGIEADDTRLDKVISELKGKNVNDVIASGEFWTLELYAI